MNIWFVNQYAIPPTQAGITRHYALAKALQKLGHDVTIIASSFDHVTRSETRLGSEERQQLHWEEGVRFWWLKTPPYSGNSLARIRNIAAFARIVGFGLPADELAVPDLVVGSSPTLAAAWGAERLARRLRVPFVLEVRDLWPESLVQLGGLSRRNPLVLALAGLERFLYRRATSIVTLLPNSSEFIVARGGRADRTFWVPNGVDLDSFPVPAPPAIRDEFKVVYAGTHGLANGLDVVLDTAALLLKNWPTCKVRFCLVGDGPHKPRLVRRATEEGLENVEFFAPVPKREMPRVLADADVFLVTLRGSELYRYGTSLNKIYDFLAAGRPVIFAAPTEHNPVLEAGAGLVVRPGSAAEMAAAIGSLLTLSPAERWRMGLNGRAFVEKYRAVSGLAQTLENIFQTALSPRVP